jgi:hypothetical protein
MQRQLSCPVRRESTFGGAGKLNEQLVMFRQKGEVCRWVTALLHNLIPIPTIIT